MKRNDRQPLRPKWCRGWSLVFAVLLLIYTAHLALVVPQATAATQTSQPMGLDEAEHSPERSTACIIKGSLGSPDRLRLGSLAVDAACVGPTYHDTAGSFVAHPIISAPPISAASLRAFLQIFLI